VVGEQLDSLSSVYPTGISEYAMGLEDGALIPSRRYQLGESVLRIWGDRCGGESGCTGAWGAACRRWVGRRRRRIVRESQETAVRAVDVVTQQHRGGSASHKHTPVCAARCSPPQTPTPKTATTRSTELILCQPGSH